jgi:hypothetical protein
MSVPSETAHPPCPRCYSEEEVVRPWAGFGAVYSVWKVGVAVLAVFSPIIASDLVVMMPLSMAFLFAGGPVIAFAQQQPTCRSCGLARPSPGWHETPCRPVRELGGAPGSCLRVSPSRPPPQSERDEDSGVRALPVERRRRQPPSD